MVRSSDIFNLILDLENPNWSTLPSNRVISKGYSVPVKRCSLCNVLMALYTKNAKQKKYCDGCRIYVTKRRLHRGYRKRNAKPIFKHEKLVMILRKRDCTIEELLGITKLTHGSFRATLTKLRKIGIIIQKKGSYYKLIKY